MALPLAMALTTLPAEHRPYRCVYTDGVLVVVAKVYYDGRSCVMGGVKLFWSSDWERTKAKWTTKIVVQPKDIPKVVVDTAQTQFSGLIEGLLARMPEHRR